MSEVQDAIQILYLTGQISYTAATMAYKILNTVYLAKWRGKTSFSRFRQIKGEESVFLNAATENKAALKKIEQEMKAHGILFAKLPDLCGGDGKTQYVLAPSDLPKFKSFLLDHQEGPCRQIKVGPIRPSDYIRTGVDSLGNPTPDLCTQSSFPEQKGKHTQQKNPNQDLPTDTPTPLPHAQKNPDDLFSTCGPHHYIQEAPIEESTRWRMYQLDPLHAVLIPRLPAERITQKNASIQDRDAICENERYMVVNLQTKKYRMESGLQVLRRYQTPKQQRYSDYLTWKRQETSIVPPPKKQIKKRR